MNGTNAPHTRAMLRTPPSTTAATRAHVTPPTSQGEMLNVLLVMEAMALACTVLPMPNDATAVKMAKSTASHLRPNPRSRAYMGPPCIEPSGWRTRYLMARSPSAYFVAMPNTPVSQHQSTAPGPPSDTAVATPTMLPVPMVAASAVASAPNCDTSPPAPLSRVTDSLMAVHSRR